MSGDDLARELDAARMLLPRLSVDRGQAIAAAGRLRTLPTLGPALAKVLDAANSMAGQGLLIGPADVVAHVGALPAGIAAADLIKPCCDLLAASESLRWYEAQWRIRQERDAIRAAAEIATGKEGSPLANMAEEVRRAIGRVQGGGYRSLSDLAREWAVIDEAIANGEAGAELLQPFFCAFARMYFHGWLEGGRLVPGMRLLIGGGSNSGKTSLANMFAVSLAAAGIPVYFWQADVDRRKHAWDLIKAYLGLPRLQRMKRDIGIPAVLDLIRAPADGVDLHDVGAIAAEVSAWCDELELQALAMAKKPNALKGVLIVDYMQMVEDANSASSNDYRRSEAVAQRLAEIAARTGVGMIWLSQVSRSAIQKVGSGLDDAKTADDVTAVLRAYAETCYQGADLRRSADTAFAITDRMVGGERRRIIISGKDRGCRFGTPFQPDKLVAALDYDNDHGGRIIMSPLDPRVLGSMPPADADPDVEKRDERRQSAGRNGRHKVATPPPASAEPEPLF